MRKKKIFILFWTIFLQISAGIVYAQTNGKNPITFRTGNDMLYTNDNNQNEIIAVKQFIYKHEDVILTGNGHIRLVAPIGGQEKQNPLTTNLAALRAAVIRNYMKQNFRMLTNWNFTFYFDHTRAYNNTVEVEYVPHAIPAEVSSVIYYTTKKNNLEAAKGALAKYGTLPYLTDAKLVESDTTNNSRLDKINAIATTPVYSEPKEETLNPKELLIAIHYRWDKANLDSLYLSNPENLSLLDSTLHPNNAMYIDTLTIVAYASPEGHPDYNLRLSERRAKTLKDYITTNYKTVSPERIVTVARGANWEGLHNFVLHDNELPFRDEVLTILNSSLTNTEKQTRLTKLNGGRTYYRYILPNYYRYLRNGASVLITYHPSLPLALEPTLIPTPMPELGLLAVANPKPIVRYPIAFRSNLLFDAVGAPNIGIEVPIGNHFSVVGDFAYAYWRSPKDLYALQTLQGGIEGRYWFGVSDKKKQKNSEWAIPLRGWNVGIYGMYCSRYDIQIIDGHQGDGFWSAGVTAGYATPIARNLSIEFSLAAGYFYTPEYRHYHKPELSPDGERHLMWQETGSFGIFSLTKARVSLVWLLRTTKKGAQK